MKISFALIAFAAIAAAVPSDFSEESPAFDELSLLQGEVKSDITTMMNKGATEADCKDLARTSCTEVRREVTVNQGLINKLKTGTRCVTLGKAGVVKMEAHWRRTKKTHNTWKIKVTNTLKKRVKVSSLQFQSLKPGRCGFIFTSRSYLAIRRTWQHATKQEITWRGRVTESWKNVLRARRTRDRLVRQCHCSTKSAEARLWRTLHSRTLITKQNKAYAKCLMMTCVLNGTNLKNRSCKGRLPALRRKRLSRATQGARCGGQTRTLRKSGGATAVRRL